MDDDQFSAVVGALYDAALEPEYWPNALEKLRIFLNGGAYAHFLWDKKTGKVPVIHFSGFSTELIEAYTTYYSTIEPGADFIRHNPGLSLLYDALWIEEKAMDRNEYHAWLERESGMRYRLGSFTANSDRYLGITAVQLSRQQGPPDERHRRLFLRILPHIRRSTNISQEFISLQSERSTLIETLQHARYGILLLDAVGRLIFANRPAEEFLAQKDGLYVDRDGRPCADRSNENSELRRLIAVTIGINANDSKQAGDTLTVSRPSGMLPYVLSLTPFSCPSIEFQLKPRASAAIFITDPELMQPPAETFLRSTYRLTPAEIRLAFTLLKTESLKQAATQLGLTEGSARQTLKRIFYKTECHSQASLIKLLLSFQGHSFR